MKKIIILLQLILLCSFTGFAQNKNEGKVEVVREITDFAKSSIDFPLMEIVHCHGQDRFFRINKETGEVWMLLFGKAYVIDLEQSPNITVYKGKVNFQLIVGSSVYLLNIHTGETWYLKDDNLFTYNKMKFALVKLKR